MRCIAAMVLAAGIGLAVPAKAQELTRGPYLQNLKKDSVEFFWRTDEPTETWAAVREKGADEPLAVHSSSLPTKHHQQLMPGLEVDTWYEYRVGYGEDEFLHEDWIPFQTLPPGDAEVFEFVLYGDHRNYPQHHRAVVDAIIERAEERGWPRFIIDTGDFTGNGEMDPDPWDNEFFEPAAPLLKRVNLYPVIGNHETEFRWPRIPSRYFENFSVPTETSGTDYYYSLRIGDLHFLMLDSWASEWETESKQWYWLQEELRLSDATWRIPVFHHPLYKHRTAPNPHQGEVNMREHFDPLFEQYGVSMVLNGHSHFYQRNLVNDIYHITSGGGGAPLYTPAQPGEGADFVQAAAETYHYCWFRVEGDEITMWAWDYNNELIDTHTFTPREPIEDTGPPLNFVQHLPTEDMTEGETYIVESRDADGNVTPPPLYFEDGNMQNSVVKSRAPGLEGDGTRFADNIQTDTHFTFQPPIEEEGTYLLSVTTPSAGSVDAPNSLFEVTQGDDELIRGQVALTHNVTGNTWYDIGLFELVPGDTVTFIQVDFEPDRFYADAVKVTRYHEE